MTCSKLGVLIATACCASWCKSWTSTLGMGCSKTPFSSHLTRLYKDPMNRSCPHQHETGGAGVDRVPSSAWSIARCGGQRGREPPGGMHTARRRLTIGSCSKHHRRQYTTTTGAASTRAGLPKVYDMCGGRLARRRPRWA